MAVIYSTHPRSRKFIEQRNFKFNDLVKNLQPFGFADYNHLQKHAFCVVSDSGTLAEESSYFKFPAVSIRTSTERPEAVDKGNFIIGGITKDQVLQAVNLAVEMNSNNHLGAEVPDYTDESVSTKVVKIIQSYTGIVNKVVWGK
jgi:UDP-N-acetylglucosamine 2-epimerase (non-hydrolysing)